MGFLKTPEIPLEGNFFRFPREAEKSRTKAVRFLKSTEIPLEGLIFHPLHVADWPRVDVPNKVGHTRSTNQLFLRFTSSSNDIVFVVCLFVSHIQRIGCQPKKLL